MQRTELIEIVRHAAFHAEMADESTSKLVEAVSDSSVTKVARGVMESRDRSCVCPLVLAGLYGLGTDTYTTDRVSVDAFWYHYDNITRELVSGCDIIQIED